MTGAGDPGQLSDEMLRVQGTVSTRINGHQLIASGYFIAEGLQEVAEVTVAGVTAALKFNDESSDGPVAQLDFTDPQKFWVHLSGFDNPLGSSVSFGMGALNGRRLEMRIVVHSIGRDRKLATRAVGWTILAMEP